MTSYAQIDTRVAYLSTDFGEEIARKWFGDESVDSLPRYTRGPRKGKIKGAVSWCKVVRGGWVRTERATADGDASGYVENRVGHIYGRKLHEIVSGQYGSSLGAVIRDLDREENIKIYAENRRRRYDEEIRHYINLRSTYEDLILSGDFDAKIVRILQKKIHECSEDVAALICDLK